MVKTGVDFVEDVSGSLLRFSLGHRTLDKAWFYVYSRPKAEARLRALSKKMRSLFVEATHYTVNLTRANDALYQNIFAQHRDVLQGLPLKLPAPVVSITTTDTAFNSSVPVRTTAIATQDQAGKVSVYVVSKSIGEKSSNRVQPIPAYGLLHAPVFSFRSDGTLNTDTNVPTLVEDDSAPESVINHVDDRFVDLAVKATGGASYLVQVVCALLAVGAAEERTDAPIRSRNAGTPPENNRPMWEVKTLVIKTPVTHTVSEYKGGTHASPRQHLRRGHYRHYKKTGKIAWVNQCTVGSLTNGYVHKDYRVEAVSAH
jgi:hypothetical protein